MKEIQSDLPAVNVSWFLEDLELYDNRISGFLESFSFTIARLVTLIMALFVHRAFYKLMKRHPGRAVNIIIYPHMVRYVLLHTKLCVFMCIYVYVFEVRKVKGVIFGKYLESCFATSLVSFILRFMLLFFFRFYSPHS